MSKYRGEHVSIIEGDITQQQVEAIVSAANQTLVGGSRVGSAIHRAAGPDLLNECLTLGGCPIGESRITGGYNLPAKYVIHTVGPVWHGGQQGEHELLASCYRSSFALLQQHDIRSVAFPAISTGGNRFPIQRAARIALSEMRDFLVSDQNIEQVMLVCFGQKALDIHVTAFREIFKQS